MPRFDFQTWVAIAIVAGFLFWAFSNAREDRLHAESQRFEDGAAWQREWRFCYDLEVARWENHYGRPADLMTEAQSAGISYHCGNRADEAVGR